ncbi:hypothetical protein [Psychroserpens algicola]|uniref:Nucleotide modification associated domain-containing protein n=1 Tax=Psychroserpens algicola TaxID=1719034 RepID=A0ABT0H3W8_9FLAO|nr:hypothetical protein [Psychroserpens algicola]MCK8479071.1 hypothetical protein [Psychroserpens algicola]
MNIYSYVVARDFGFAPNPFGRYCTLATCKPKIRENASIGDWIIGTGSAGYNLQKWLMYAMKVEEKITFVDYWNDIRFQYKKPIMNGSLVQMYGDNIYSFDELRHKWLQSDSHHSYADGSINKHNLNRDLGGKYVLISEEFYYFGKDAIEIPKEYSSIIKTGPGYKKNIQEDVKNNFINFLKKNFQLGYHSDPIHLVGEFKNYDGVS